MAKSKAVVNNNEEAPTEVTTYSEWDVKITNKEAEKLKVSRERVVISDEEAETLNTGVLQGNNTYAKMYYKN